MGWTIAQEDLTRQMFINQDPPAEGLIQAIVLVLNTKVLFTIFFKLYNWIAADFKQVGLPSTFNT